MFNDPNNPYNNYSNLQDVRFSKKIESLGLQQTFSGNFDKNTIIDDDNSKNKDNKDTSVIFKKHVYNIDSRNRNKQPHNIFTGKNIYLPQNALIFKKKSSIVTITAKNHGLAKGNNIILQNVKSNIYQSKGGIELTNDSNFVKIIQINHQLENIITDDIDYKIKISGLKGNNNKYTFGNIPISLINSEHTVHLFANGSTQSNSDYYFIKLDLTADINTTTLSDTTSNIVIEHKNLYGVPLNLILDPSL